MTDSRMIDWVSSDTGMDRKTVTLVIESFWETVKDRIENFPTSSDDEDFDRKCCVNIPMLGKFYTTRGRVNRVTKNINNKIKKYNERFI